MKKVIIVGAGFGGLQAVKKLSKNKNLDITLVDKKNHHLFQPLLYQVATAVLSAPDIAIPSRHLAAKMKNVDVIMNEVQRIDLDKRRVYMHNKMLEYDYLILAMGAQTGYFGNENWGKNSLPLKNLSDALEIRNRMLTAFEQAENHPDKVRELLSFIIVGGGPTGVELSGSIAELSKHIIRKEYRHIDTGKTKVILIEAGPDLLPTFDRTLSSYTKEQLIKRGVTVLTDTKVMDVFKNGVKVKDISGMERNIEASFVIWAAGVEAIPITRQLGFPVDRSGRVEVNQYCSFKKHPEVFAIGDMADFKGENGKPLPGVSPVAMQQGRYVAELIKSELKGTPRKPFKYHDKGSMATIGRKTAIAEKGSFKFKGTIGWFGWLFVHLFYQVGFKNKISILITWIWSYLTFGASARVIIKPFKMPIIQPVNNLTNEIIFRKVKPGEYEDVLRLSEKIWKRSFESILTQDRLDYLYNFMYGGETVKKQIESGAQEYFIIENNKMPISYASISKEQAGKFKLQKLYMLLELQGKGFASKIMNEIVELIKTRGGKTILLTVNRANARAIRFYEKYGFTITGEENFDVGGGHVMDDYIMEFKISKNEEAR